MAMKMILGERLGNRTFEMSIPILCIASRNTFSANLTLNRPVPVATSNTRPVLESTERIVCSSEGQISVPRTLIIQCNVVKVAHLIDYGFRLSHSTTSWF